MSHSVSAIVRSGTDTSPQLAFEKWEALVTAAFVPLSVTPADGGANGLPPGQFRAHIADTQFEQFGAAVIGATTQRIARTRRHIARSDQDYLLVSIQRTGRARMEQGGRRADWGPGSLVLIDTSRPFAGAHAAEAESVMLRIPLDRLLASTGLVPADLPMATPIAVRGTLAVVAEFLCGLAELGAEADPAAELLAGHGFELLAGALSLIAGDAGYARNSPALIHEVIAAYVRDHHADPAMTVEEVAHACGLSRRSLYRACEQFGGFGALVRRTRLEHARNLLREPGSRSLATIAGAAGFADERNFYRVFRQEMGMTPSEFRAQSA
ncbi:AraC family transcriptional regulator [Nocardia sp. NPDC056000]|uniref:AraC family transcriptional regulator n=1 Tax=Nocardia sp. NPDC056000 TaxID=3345674 RepID=UPI0035DBD923